MSKKLATNFSSPLPVNTGISKQGPGVRECSANSTVVKEVDPVCRRGFRTGTSWNSIFSVVEGILLGSIPVKNQTQNSKSNSKRKSQAQNVLSRQMQSNHGVTQSFEHFWNWGKKTDKENKKKETAILLNIYKMTPTSNPCTALKLECLLLGFTLAAVTETKTGTRRYLKTQPLLAEPAIRTPIMADQPPVPCMPACHHALLASSSSTSAVWSP